MNLIMKSFKDFYIKKEYRSNIDDIVKDFYLPLLTVSKGYDRAVGFFSSSALAEVAKGISTLVANGGKIRIVASPYLYEEDIDAIELGYRKRDEVISESLIKELKEPVNEYEAKQLNILANLIADKVLDIKIALTENDNKIGMYHEKMGLLYDLSGNTIAFSGSMNESLTAFSINVESIDVYCDWKNQDEKERVQGKKDAFKRIWGNEEDKITTKDFPEVKNEIINKYKRTNIDYKNLTEVVEEQTIKPKDITHITNEPKRPEFLKELRYYQEEAINAWLEKGCRGIFVMATGTGKTYTGLAASVELYKRVEGRLAMVIVCPQQHLVDQWVEDLNEFNIKPIIGHSESIQKDYKKRLHKAVLDYKLGVNNFFCFICTNATFATEYVQNEMNKIKDNSFLMVDEAHNFGAEKIKETLKKEYTYRLALSATFDRHNDPDGTSCLENFFGDKCIDYGIEEAIENGMLTEYYYYPIVTSLTDGELLKYKQLTEKISKCVQQTKSGKTKLSKAGEMYALERSRLVAAAKNKNSKLLEIMEDYKDDHDILVYCGAATIFDDEQEENSDIKQIDEITYLLGKQLGMSVAQFTANESAEQRKLIIKNFEDASELQALVAIKCLDEGVNIPSVRTAFILASTTNPKEYIQRRGRVLRLYEGKEYAKIYDFITLPRPIEDLDYMLDEELKGDITLVKNELKRIIEFKRIARNPYDSDYIISELIDSYNLNDFIYEEGTNGARTEDRH